MDTNVEVILIYASSALALVWALFNAVVIAGIKLGPSEHGDSDAKPSSGSPIRLPEIRAARLFKTLQGAKRIGQANLGKARIDVSATALEHPENVRWRHNMPGRQRHQTGQNAPRHLLSCQNAWRIAR